MRQFMAFLACTAVAVGVLAISSEPVYIKGPEGAKAVTTAIEKVKSELGTVKRTPELDKLLSSLDLFLGDLQTKSAAVKKVSVEVTKEYRGIADVRDRLKPLLKEHVLLPMLDGLLKKVETASK